MNGRNGSVNVDQVCAELDPICKKFGGSCTWDGHNGQFYLVKAHRGSRFHLCLRFKKTIAVEIYAHVNQRAAKDALSKILMEGKNEISDMTVAFDSQSKDIAGVVVRFYPLMAPNGLAANLKEVKVAVERVLAKLKAINAIAVLALAAR